MPGPDTPDMTKDMPDEGSVFAGQFQIVRKEAEGASGVVYRAQHILMGTQVALKILRRDILQDDRAAKRFLNESKAISRLAHPNIVHGISAGISEDGHPFIVQEYFEGKTLAQILEQERTLSPENFKAIFTQIFSALEHAHNEGVIHRDLTASNILVDANGTVKIVDFGVAKLTLDSEKTAQLSRATQTGAVIGTPLYISPEQAMGKSSDARSDIYSLGVLMYQCLTGNLPFTAENSMQVLYMHINEKPAALKLPPNMGLNSQGLDNVIQKCLSKEPASRFQTVSELQSSLSAALSEKLPVRTNQTKVVIVTSLVLISTLAAFAICTKAGWWVNSSNQTKPVKRIVKSNKDSSMFERRLNSSDPRRVLVGAYEARHTGRQFNETEHKAHLDYYNQAINLFDHAIDLLHKSPNDFLMFTANLGKARCLSDMVDTCFSVDQTESPRIKKLKDTQLLCLVEAKKSVHADWFYEEAMLMRELGTAYEQHDSLGLARQCLERARALKEKDPEMSAISTELSADSLEFINKDYRAALEDIYCHLGSVYSKLHLLSAAKDSYKKLWQLVFSNVGNPRAGPTEQDNFDRLCNCIQFLGTNYRDSHAAVQHIDELATQVANCLDAEVQAHDYSRLAAVCRLVGQPDLAADFLNKASRWINQNPRKHDQGWIKRHEKMRSELKM